MKTFILIGILLISSGLLAQIATPPTIGMGTLEDPFHIESFEHLYYITLDSGTWGMHFIQTANIDASDSALIPDEAPNTHGWLPIGRGSTQFTGSYDGGGFQIINLYMNRPNHEFNGLFGYIIGGKVWNVHLRNASIIGGHYAGILSGVAHANSVISLCSATGSVSGTYNVGGLIGFSNNSQISNSYAHANAVGWDRVGGFIGTSGWDDQHTYISSCYSTGSATSIISGSVGGFSGWGGYSYHRNCYWDTQSSGLTYSVSGLGKTTVEMRQQATFPMWNFYNLWMIDEGNSYPDIQAMPGYAQPAELSLSDLSGSGTETNPYLISNADELNLLRDDLSAHYKLVSDIDLSASVIWNYGTGWLPPGTTDDPFTGSLDGSFHRITGLIINRLNTDNQGLFGFCNGALIISLDLRETYIAGRDNCGGISGYARNTTIDNIDLKGTITGFYAGGGITGVMAAGSILRCFADVNIKNINQYTGGIAGITLDFDGYLPSLEECGSNGILQGGHNVGGIVGYHTRGDIADCFSLAALNGIDQIGGIVGALGSFSASATINRSYATGMIQHSSSAFRLGGIVGWHMGGSIADCYWDTESSLMSSSGAYSGGTGLNTSQMSYPGSLDYFHIWDFANTWQQDTSSLQNFGYPYLLWQLPPASGLEISETDGQILLSWQGSPRIDHYRVYASMDPNAPGETWEYLGQTPGTSFSLPAQGKQFFMLKAIID